MLGFAVLRIAVDVRDRSGRAENLTVGVGFLILALIYGAAAAVRISSSPVRPPDTHDDEKQRQ
jgi:hypothetical protein